MNKKIKDPAELLKIDFNKYSSIGINGVVLSRIKIETNRDRFGISLIGRINGEVMMSTSFLNTRKVKIMEIDANFISIDEVRNGESVF